MEDRRGFLKAAGAGVLSAAAYRNVLGANERVRVGFIGIGLIGKRHLLDFLAQPDVEAAAICEVYEPRLREGVATVEEKSGRKAEGFKDFRRMYDRKDIDAVVVSTPDHWHAPQTVLACASGKDVYVEKPLTYTIDEGAEIIAAVKKTGRMLQVGSQNISSPTQIKAREIVASGRLGQITMIRATVNRNTAGGAWIYPIPPDANPETVNWEMFLGSATKRPFSLERFFRWRCYEEYSGGMATDLFVHVMTTIHFVMGAQAPEMVVAAGSLYRWKESRDVPDTLDAIMQYPEGFTVNLSGTFNNQSAGERGIQILGTKGTLTLGRDLVFTPDNPIEDNDWIVASWPGELQKAYYNDPKVIAAEMPQRWDPKIIEGEERWNSVGRNSVMLHFENFQKSIRERKQPVEDVYAGHRAAAVAHMVNWSAKHKKPVFWDRSRDNVKA